MRFVPHAACGLLAVAALSAALGASAEPPAPDPVAPQAGLPGHPPPRIGVELHPMTAELRAFFEVDPERGVLVARVQAESPAEAAGIEVGDVILRVEGQDIREPADLAELAARAPAGEALEIELSRRGKESTLTLIPRGRPWERYFDAQELWGPGQGGMWKRLLDKVRELEERLESLEKQKSGDDVDRT